MPDGGRASIWHLPYKDRKKRVHWENLGPAPLGPGGIQMSLRVEDTISCDEVRKMQREARIREGE